MCTRQLRFNPRSPCGERRRTARTTMTLPCFNPRSPCGERQRHLLLRRRQRVSTHAPLAGSDVYTSRLGRTTAKFQPTLPLRGATGKYPNSRIVEEMFQPTLPLRGATTPNATKCAATLFQPTLPLRGATSGNTKSSRQKRVSTHAPLAGSDRCASSTTRGPRQVSTHAPLAGSDRKGDSAVGYVVSFNPRSPCGERPRGRAACRTTPCFNPRSPCGERPVDLLMSTERIEFQPTLPLRGATNISGYLAS